MKQEQFISTKKLASDLYLLGINFTLKAYFAIRQTSDSLMWIQSWLLTFLSNAMTMWFSFDYSAIPFIFKTSEQLAYQVKHSTGTFYCCASAYLSIP